MIIRTPLYALLMVTVGVGTVTAQSSRSPAAGLTSRFMATSTGEPAFQIAYSAVRSDKAGTVDSTNEKSCSFRRRPLYHLGYAGKTFVSDLGYIYSSPARLNQRSALWLGGIVAVGAVIYVFDQEIHDAFRRSRDATLYKPIRKTGEAMEKVGFMGKTNKFYLAGILAGYLIGWEPMVVIPAEILEAQLIAGTLKDGANILVGRSRPFEDRGPRHYRFNEGTSFPSGHAKNVIIAANVIARRVNFLPVTIAAYGLAGTICLERITSDTHWPSDVYFAAVYGWIISNELGRRHDSDRIAVAPVASDGSPGLSVRLTF
jgi:membrane-associated phospholipid phosphatase